jgi:hypothetical protein
MKKLIFLSVVLILAILAISATTVMNARLVSSLSVDERLTTASINQVVQHNQLNEVVNFRATTDSATTDVDNVYGATLTGIGTLDLTALTNSLGDVLDLTGERIMAIKLKNSSTTGSDTINITQGALNPYPLMGTTYSFDLKPRQSILFKADTLLSDVSTSALGIDYTCNGDTLGILLISANLY